MSKKTNTPARLSFSDIVLGADADTIRQALEARTQIDELLAERAQAYERIAGLESQVEELIGDEASFPFPDPPLPVYGFRGTAPAAKKKVAKKAAPAPRPAAQPPASQNRPAGDTPATGATE